jgi:hypothetical protein
VLGDGTGLSHDRLRLGGADRKLRRRTLRQLKLHDAARSQRLRGGRGPAGGCRQRSHRPLRHFDSLSHNHLNETVANTARRFKASLWESGCKKLLRSLCLSNWSRRSQCPLRLKTASTVDCRCSLLPVSRLVPHGEPNSW